MNKVYGIYTGEILVDHEVSCEEALQKALYFTRETGIDHHVRPIDE